jgi:hypothetical protein
MKVNFKRDFFHSNGRFRERDNPHEVPDDMVDTLPPDVEIVEGFTKPKRSRTKDGEYKGDDKSTPKINEAWEGGKAPKAKPKAKPKSEKT